MIAPGSGGWASRNIADDGVINISKEDLAEMLRATIDETLTADELRDWVNLILFNDAFEFEGEAIRDALDHIEESDEPGAELDTDEMNALLKSLH